MQLTITQQDVLETIKPVTKASCEDWGKAIRAVVTVVATLYAFLYTSITYVKYLYQNPLEALAAGNRALAGREQLTPVAEALPLPLTIVPEVEVTETTKPKPRTRTRKRSSKGAANTTPAVVA